MAYSNFYGKFLDLSRTISVLSQAFWRYYPNKIYLALALLFQGATWWQALWIKVNLSSELLVFRYKIDFGANLIGESSLILNYPLISLAVLFVNSVIVLILSKHKYKKAFSHSLMSSAVIFSFFMSIYLFSVFLINFR